MNIQTLKECLLPMARAGVVPIIWGSHGIGKSSAVKQLGAEQKARVIDLRLALLEPGDLLGLADVSAGITKFCPPSYLPRDPLERVILFLDEINRARRDILNAVFQLVLDRQVGEYRLPPLIFDENGAWIGGTIVVAAANPPTDDFVVNDLADSALLSRFCHVKLTPTENETLTFLKGRAPGNPFVQYLAETGIKATGKAFTVADFVRVDNRAKEAFARLLQEGLPTDTLRELGHGLVGVEETTGYFSWLATQDKALTFEEVVVAGFQAPTVTRLKAAVAAQRMDWLAASNAALVEGFKPLDKAAVTALGPVNETLLTYVKLLPADLAVGFMVELLTNSAGLLEVHGDDAKLAKLMRQYHKKEKIAA